MTNVEGISTRYCKFNLLIKSVCRKLERDGEEGPQSDFV